MSDSPRRRLPALRAIKIAKRVNDGQHCRSPLHFSSKRLGLPNKRLRESAQRNHNREICDGQCPGGPNVAGLGHVVMPLGSIDPANTVQRLPQINRTIGFVACVAVVNKAAQPRHLFRSHLDLNDLAMVEEVLRWFSKSRNMDRTLARQASRFQHDKRIKRM